MKDQSASRVTYEPLASFDADGNLIPFLASEIPSTANGGLAIDGKSVTWKLKPGVKWSDGEPFSADDVRFTWQYATNPDVAAISASAYAGVTDVEVVDPTTVTVHFACSRVATPSSVAIIRSASGTASVRNWNRSSRERSPSTNPNMFAGIGANLSRAAAASSRAAFCAASRTARRSSKACQAVSAHGHEVSALVDPASLRYLLSEAQVACRDAFAGYVGHALAGSRYITSPAIPTAEAQAAGAKEAICLVARSDGGWMDHPARGSGE